MADKKTATEKKPKAKKEARQKRPAKGFILLLGMFEAIKHEGADGGIVTGIELSQEAYDDVKKFLKKENQEDYEKWCAGKFCAGDITVAIDKKLEANEMSFSCKKRKEEAVEEEKISRGEILKMLIYEWFFFIVFAFFMVHDGSDAVEAFAANNMADMLISGIFAGIFLILLLGKVRKISVLEKKLYTNIKTK